MRSKIIFIFLNPVWLFYAALEDIDSESMRSFILTVAPHKKTLHDFTHQNHISKV